MLAAFERRCTSLIKFRLHRNASLQVNCCKVIHAYFWGQHSQSDFTLKFNQVLLDGLYWLKIETNTWIHYFTLYRRLYIVFHIIVSLVCIGGWMFVIAVRWIWRIICHYWYWHANFISRCLFSNSALMKWCFCD